MRNKWIYRAQQRVSWIWKIICDATLTIFQFAAAYSVSQKILNKFDELNKPWWMKIVSKMINWTFYNPRRAAIKSHRQFVWLSKEYEILVKNCFRNWILAGLVWNSYFALNSSKTNFIRMPFSSVSQVLNVEHSFLFYFSSFMIWLRLFFIVAIRIPWIIMQTFAKSALLHSILSRRVSLFLILRTIWCLEKKRCEVWLCGSL